MPGTSHRHRWLIALLAAVILVVFAFNAGLVFERSGPGSRYRTGAVCLRFAKEDFVPGGSDRPPA